MKKDNGKQNRGKNSSGQTLPIIDNSSFNQTIIINNPKININYIEQNNNSRGMNGTAAHFKKENNTKGFQDNSKNQQEFGKDSSKGFDAWNLNKNLKEFSQTRQLGFFKGSNGAKNKNSQQSPYLVHKTKTQDLRPVNKLAPSPYSQKAYEPSFKEHNRTISTTRRQAIQVLERETERDHSEPHRNYASSKPYMNQNQKFRSKKYELTDKIPKTTKHILSQRTIMPLQQPYLKKGVSDNPKHQRKYGSTVTTMLINQTSKIRLRNLQESKKTTRKSEQDMDQNYEEYDEFLNTKSVRKRNSPLKNDQEYQNQNFENLSENQDSENMENSLINESPLLNQKQKKKPKTQDHLGKTQNLYPKRNHRTYQRSIQKISDCFLRKVDNYFDHVDTFDIPSSKIQLYASTIHQPQMFSSCDETKNTTTGQKQQMDKMCQGYDFQFQEQKTKKRPKTPFKRKKMYEALG